MEDNSAMDIACKNPNVKNKRKENYVYCSNISRWVPAGYLMDLKNPAFKFAIKGVISYKFIGKCHLPPNRFRFIEFNRNEEEQRAHRTASNSKIELNDKTLSENIAELKNNINEIEKKSSHEVEEISGPALIDKLDDDCLIEIFLFLPMEKRLEMENVCVRWRNVSQKAWNDIQELILTPNQSTSRQNPKFFEELLVRFGFSLNSLKLYETKLSSDLLLVIPKYCHNLTKITLRSTSCDVNCYNAFSKMKKLQSFTTQQADSKCLKNSLLSLPKTIQCIDICVFPDHRKRNLPEGIIDIFEEFDAIDSLTIRWVKIRKDLIKTISEKETITKLNLSACKIGGGLKLLANLINLEKLDLEGVDDVNDNFLTCLSMECKKLKHLNVNYCRKLSDEGIRELKNLDNLEVLLINMGQGFKNRHHRYPIHSSISDLALSQLKGIRILECKYCWEVRDPGIRELIKNSPDLERLDVRLTSISEETLRLAMSVIKDRRSWGILDIHVFKNPLFIGEYEQINSSTLNDHESGGEYDLEYGYLE